MAKAIGTLGTIPTLSMGGKVFTDLTNLIILHGTASGTQAFSTLRRPNGTSGYQVTTGVTLTIEAFRSSPTAAAKLASITLLYGDNDVGFITTTAPTTPVYLAGNSGTPKTIIGISYLSTTSGTLALLEGFTAFGVPATKYPASSIPDEGAVTVVGYAG